MSYPPVYHAAFNAIIHRPHGPDTRRKVALLLRWARREHGRHYAKRQAGQVALVSWPVKMRPNGRYL